MMKAETISLTERFSPAEYIINIIRRAVINSQNVRIESPRLGGVTILSKDGEYFSDVNDMSSFCQLDSSAFKVIVLNDAKVRQYKTGIGRNIDELLWCSGFYASQGRLMEGCMWDDVIELCDWPNFTHLPIRQNFLRIAALLAKHATSIEYTISVLRVSREEAYQFYSAASCAGAVRTVNRPVKEPSLKPHRNHALLSLLFDRIAQI